MVRHVEDLMVKSLSDACRESRIKSVKAIRFEAPKIISSQLELCEDSGTKPKDNGDAKILK